MNAPSAVAHPLVWNRRQSLHDPATGGAEPDSGPRSTPRPPSHLRRSAVAVQTVLPLLFASLALYQLPMTRINIGGGSTPYFVIFLLLLIPLGTSAVIRCFKRSRILALIVFTLALATCLAGAGNPAQDWIEAAKRIGYLLSGVYVYALATEDPRLRDRALLVYTLTASGMAVYGFYLLHIGYGEAAKLFYFGLHYTSATRNSDAYFLILPLFSAVGLVLSPQTPRSIRSALMVGAIVMGAGLTLSMSRAAWITVPVGLSGLYLTVGRHESISAVLRRWRFVTVALCFTFAALLLALSFASVPLFDTLGARAATILQFSASVSNDSNAQRLDLLQAGFTLIAENPLLGVGVGGVSGALKTTPLAGLQHFENLYVNAWAEYGLVGFIGVVLFTIWPVQRLWSRLRTQDASPLVAALFWGLIASLGYALTTTVADEAYFWILPLLVAAST